MDKFVALWKGYKYRRNNLPNSIRLIQKILSNSEIVSSNNFIDGRTNSCDDEKIIIDILLSHELLKGRITQGPTRHWYDIAVKDYRYGLLPINIKSSMCRNADNVGNMSIIVQSLTNYNLMDNYLKKRDNGSMSKIYLNYVKNPKTMKNTILKKDYYFIVFNKNKTDRTEKIYANSIRGLTNITSNINNLPFQVKWIGANTKFKYYSIDSITKKINKAIYNPKKSWREEFLYEMRKLFIED